MFPQSGISQSSYLHSEYSSLFLIVTDGNISNLGFLFHTEGVWLSHSGDRVNQETVDSMDEATKYANLLFQCGRHFFRVFYHFFRVEFDLTRGETEIIYRSYVCKNKQTKQPPKKSLKLRLNVSLFHHLFRSSLFFLLRLSNISQLNQVSFFPFQFGLKQFQIQNQVIYCSETKLVCFQSII